MDSLYFECVRCGAKIGQWCQDYRGRNKAICRHRGEPTQKPRRARASTAWQQTTIPGLLDESQSKGGETP